MAGLLYLPRIFVYHADGGLKNKSEDLISTFKIMGRRLFIYIMNPAMIISWIFGVLLIHTIDYLIPGPTSIPDSSNSLDLGRL